MRSHLYHLQICEGTTVSVRAESVRPDVQRSRNRTNRFNSFHFYKSINISFIPCVRFSSYITKRYSACCAFRRCFCVPFILIKTQCTSSLLSPARPCMHHLGSTPGVDTYRHLKETILVSFPSKRFIQSKKQLISS